MATNRRGFTLVEMMFVSVMAVIVLGCVATIYSYTMSRTMRNVNQTAAIMQAEGLLDEIQSYTQQAMSCTTVTAGSNTGLKCIMPSTGTDKDGDGVIDDYTPSGVNKRQIAVYTRGKRLWFYMSSDGNLANVGTNVYAAQRADDSNATSDDLLHSFYQQPGSINKWGLIDKLTFVVTSGKYVDVTVRASTLARKDQALGGTVTADRDSYSVTLTRRITWRNWWQ
jgi:type II secretory pathway pseudopilin PulG